jgi:hypothetical protein
MFEIRTGITLTTGRESPEIRAKIDELEAAYASEDT